MQKNAALIVAVLVAIPLLLLVVRGRHQTPGAGGKGGEAFSISPPAGPFTFTQSFQAVLLSNGLAYYGRVSSQNERFLELREVYYVQSGVEQGTKKQKSILLRRGKEWHAPDRMVINLDHVVFIEPVNPESDVARLIKESESNESRK